MLFPIRPTTTEPRRVENVSVRATTPVAGITAANGFNQPGVVVTIGDGARNLARAGQDPESEKSVQDPRVPTEGRESSRGRVVAQGWGSVATQLEEEAEPESVFVAQGSDAGAEGVFNEDESEAALVGAAGPDEPERSGIPDDEQFQSVWKAEGESDDVNAPGVPYAALQRAASVQDLDVEDVAKALAHTQIAVRVLATQERLGPTEVPEAADTEDVQDVDDVVEPSRLSSLPTDGVPYEALQRAVTEAENAQGIEGRATSGSPTEPVFLAPENGGAPWGREVPFEDEAKRGAALNRQAMHKEHGQETQPQA